MSFSDKEYLFFESPFKPGCQLKDKLEEISRGEFIVDYLKNLEVKTAIVEKYIDKDYLIDFQKFYSRSFKDHKRYTHRIHFFKNLFTADEFKYFLRINETSSLKSSYLGFVIIKPIKGQDAKWLLGRTILKPPKNKKKGYKYIKNNYKVSLFGIPLKIKSLPFQVQDRGVGACATIALWTAINPLSKIFEIGDYSPSEITEISSTFPSHYRTFPSSGLTWDQMISGIKKIGLDLEVINVEVAPNDELFVDAIKAYIENGVPLIAGLRLEKSG